MKRLLLVAGIITLGVFELTHISEAFASPQVLQKPKTLNFNQKPSSAGGGNLIPRASDGWSKSKITAEGLATLADSGLGALRNTEAIVSVTVSGKDGHGFSDCKMMIKDPTTFHLEYPIIEMEKTQKGKMTAVLTKAASIANGKRLAYFVGDKGVIESKPLSVAKFAPYTPAVKWPYEFPRTMLSAINNGHPFAELIKSVRQAGSGLTALVEERSFSYRGSLTHQFRLTVQKVHPNQGAPIYIQATIDGTQRLPVSVITKGAPTSRPEMDFVWRAAWGRVKPYKLIPSMFDIPASTSLTKH